uniref:Abi-like protein n=1 Tax=Myoviridae sp. ctsip2 TaxID=2826705 RepID=A0A8S5N608_9CAUD|nr:MAG TPA: Abi-like protein [Myoviridae sp. ctsip2]
MIEKRYMSNSENLKKYQSTLSIERIKAFSCGINDKEEFLLKVYELNIETSKDLYPALCMFEVHLRNAIDVMLQNIFTTTWLEDEIKTQNILLDKDYKTLKYTYNLLKTRYGVSNITHGKLVSGLSLGFWVSLCSKKYNPKIWTKKGAFRSVFVNYPKNKKEHIQDISEKLTKIKNLRNRVFHFEPILYKSEKCGELYNLIPEIMAYLPKDNSNLFEKVNRFPQEITKTLSTLQSR